ncbi:MAG: DNA topoisomerase [Candidatus Njordarchaeum guaymaensis]
MSDKKITPLDTWFTKDSENTESSNEQETIKKEKDISEISIKKGKTGLLSSLIQEFDEKIKIPDLIDMPHKKIPLKNLVGPGKRILIVAEKNRAAKAIARALGKYKSRKLGTKNRPVFIYETTFLGRFFSIVPLQGHIMEYVPISKYSGRWEKTDPRELINPDSLIIKESIPEIIDVLEKVSTISDALIIATDADEEGSNIGLEAYRIVSQKKEIPIARMWFISVRPSELKNALLELIEPKWNWAHAVEARRIIDAMVGFSATRELTTTFKDIVLKLQTKVLSIGRVQTPTLYLLYLREKEIREFKPEPYWTLKATFIRENIEFVGIHEKSPFKSEEEARQIYNKVKDAKIGTTRNISINETAFYAPTPLNTTKALSAINDYLGIPAYRAMNILEDLYLGGLITYPRTETDKYPSNYDHKSNIETLTQHKEFGSYASKILNSGVKLRRNGSKMLGDHLPITPIDIPKSGEKNLPTKEHKMIYDFIVRRYLALFFDPAILRRKKVWIDINGEIFISNGLEILKAGFLDVYPFIKPKESRIPVEKKGDIVDIKEIIAPKKKFTTPPPYISEGELIRIMERLGLGTKSTRQDHIETLIKRKYIKREGKKLKCTDIGYTLAAFLENIWPDFVKPFFSAKVHILMRRVMNKELDWQEMTKQAQEEFLELFDELRRNKSLLGKRIYDAVSKHIESEKLISCPKCGGPMIVNKLSSGKINLLQCLECGYKVTIPVAKAYKPANVKCIRCSGETIILKRGKRYLYLCPFCWGDVGPCFKCPDLDKCEMKEKISKEEEKYLVGFCDDKSVKAIYVPDRRIVICSDRKSGIFFLPKTGSLRLLKKKCPNCGWRIFSVRERGKVRYFCVKCGNIELKK